MDSGVATEPIEDWARYEDELLRRLGADSKIIRLLHKRAKSNPKRIVFAEADHLDVLKAAQYVYDERIVIPILLGNEKRIHELREELEFDGDVEIIDPKSDEQLERRRKFAQIYWESRKRKGVTELEAKKIMRERNYFAAMLVNDGYADGLISGYSRSYPTVVRPMLELIGTAKGVRKAATTNLMITERGPIFLSDTSINIDPSARELAKIAQMTAMTAKMFGIQPNIAMLSYSNFGSSQHENAKKVSEAVAFLHRYYPDINVDGEVQADFALNREMLSQKFPFSKLAGRELNTFVFPNLDSANITYKLMKELYSADSIGPIMLGMRKPVHILQLGASVEEMINMAAVAAVDAQEKEKWQQRKEEA